MRTLRAVQRVALLTLPLRGLQIVLAHEPSLVDGAPLAALEDDLEEPHACVDEQRPARHV